MALSFDDEKCMVEASLSWDFAENPDPIPTNIMHQESRDDGELGFRQSNEMDIVD
jgi:hypothetical protein